MFFVIKLIYIACAQLEGVFFKYPYRDKCVERNGLMGRIIFLLFSKSHETGKGEEYSEEQHVYSKTCIYKCTVFLCKSRITLKKSG